MLTSPKSGAENKANRKIHSANNSNHIKRGQRAHNHRHGRARVGIGDDFGRALVGRAHRRRTRQPRHGLQRLQFRVLMKILKNFLNLDFEAR